MERILVILLAILHFSPALKAQIGDYRNTFAIGVNGGYTFTNVGFSPKVTQTYKPGLTGGLSLRYTSEKYFNTICSIYAEFNYTQMGWREDILTMESEPVINEETGAREKYDRRITYFQMPVMAHLAWGRETKGFSFFFQAGPQFGYMLGESTETNFTLGNANYSDRANTTVAQDTMAVENKFDYGICAGLGVEYSHPRIGHLRLEARYYLGLANIYGSSKRDYFSKSNQSAIEIKLAYLFDLGRRKE